MLWRGKNVKKRVRITFVFANECCSSKEYNMVERKKVKKRICFFTNKQTYVPAKGRYYYWWGEKE